MSDELRVMEQRLEELEGTFAERICHLEEENARGRRVRGALVLLIGAIALISVDASYDSEGKNFRVQTRQLPPLVIEALASTLAIAAGAVITGKPDALVSKFVGK